MTGWRRSSSPRPSRTNWVRAVCMSTAVAAAGTSLVTGCGVFPGGTGGSREPVTVMTFAPIDTRTTNMPGMPAMAKAYARWAKANGGLDGHELRVITCNEENTPSGAATCARRAVKEGAVAVVGSYSQHGDAFMAPLEAAGIPFIGGYGISEEEFSSYLSYPVNGGQAALLAGNGQQLADVCGKVSLVRPNSLAGDELPGLLNAGLAQGNGRESTDILAAEDATDFTAQAKQARKKAGGLTGSGTASGSESDDRPGCVTAALGDRTETFVDSFRRLPEDSRKIRISSVVGSVGQPLIDRTGGRNGPLEGAYITGWYPDAADPRWGEMQKVIRAHAFGDNLIDSADAGVQTTWIGYTVLKTAIKSLDTDEITPSKIARALDDGVRVPTGGLTPTLRWDYDDMLGAPGFPRIVNRGVTFQVVRDGRLVAQKPGFVDVSKTLSKSASEG
ncbi:ABC transporter substrate-binding protein [Streptomyces lunaelactis]|uniref:ABC transporter substrate-binding protein n=1 Tax=Streptomyces lunaelactis TaxID=1535768 RepID=UPI001584A0C4|nr:ABC transporter substrate-binding protein [Streptomyces lunaelactis]NUK34213.1 ABC transporter substrate-binding protein [Streptomyces lunaelactis]NUK41021.1 ABC transporter substrate-binding protein [Streptomyces lunaelactis]NUK57169.1 ABC transporter substrate-binding protein [Streptomyces lunaelactis]NUK92917.1 ABC transporter substrate-binding protein [Streptomyces lunaelactis]NUL30638.1 ABC transporter substrate-binding protein [Streptomyces lunaelactis]